MATPDPRDARIAELERLLTAALARIETLEARVVALEERNAQLAARNAELEVRNAELQAQLKTTSRNSSRPPSSDPPGTPPRRQPPTGRKPGGQPGHKGHERALLPPDKVDEFVALAPPERCPDCAGALVRAPEDAARVHQQVELPRVAPHVTEYARHAAYCGACDTWHEARLPQGVTEGAFGPRLTAFIALSTGRFRLSKRLVQELLADVMGVEVALGNIARVEQRVSAALAAPVEEARAYVRAQPAVHQDETGWWQKHARAWLWLAATSAVAVFLIVKSRGTPVAKRMLGEGFAGVLVSDRWCAYRWVHALRRQLCWAHLVREFEGFLEHGRSARRIGKALLAEAYVLFEWWHDFEAGRLRRTSLQKKMRPLMREVERLLEEGARVCPRAVAGTCRDVLKVKDALWTYVYRDGVVPTNNLAERDLRHAVLWRKTSFGTHSEAGSRYVERILTTVTTLRKQRRPVLDYLTDALVARAEGREAPSLLPASEPQLSLAAA